MPNLSEEDMKQHVALLRRRKYAESTIRRGITALKGLVTHKPLVRPRLDR